MNEELLKKLRSEIDYLDFWIDGSKAFSHGHPDLRVGYAIGEGMAMFGKPCGPLYIANTETNEVKQLVDKDGHVVGFGDQDFDWEKLKGVEHRRCLDNMQADYGGMGRYSDFRNGICCIYWMLYPDGRYFADEDGYGMEDNEEENIYCIIDRHLNVLFPFEPMTYNRRNMLLRLPEKSTV